MKLSQALGKYVEQAMRDDAYWIEQSKLDFSQTMEQRRRACGLSYAALAKKLGTSAAYITKIFRGDANLTIESMSKLARATGGRLHIDIQDERSDGGQWMKLATLAAGTVSTKSIRTANVVAISSYRENGERQAA